MAKLGLQHAAARRKKRAIQLAKQQKAWRKFRRQWPQEAKFLEQVRESSEEFQRAITYTLADQMDDLFHFASKMKAKKREKVLQDLNAVFPSKRDASPYLALMKAGSVPGYDKLRVLSKNALKIQAGIAKNVPTADFGDWRKDA